jgi:hypothetical protein
VPKRQRKIKMDILVCSRLEVREVVSVLVNNNKKNVFVISITDPEENAVDFVDILYESKILKHKNVQKQIFQTLDYVKIR